MSPYSFSGSGMRGAFVDNEGLTKVLVEVLTFYEGMYGRFLVLVTLGLGCSVWYNFAPGTYSVPPSDWLTPIECYDPFFNMEYNSPLFRRVSFVETNDVSASVESAFTKEVPFAEIVIPAGGNLLKAVSLGVMVAFFLAVGIVPNMEGNIQL